MSSDSRTAPATRPRAAIRRYVSRVFLWTVSVAVVLFGVLFGWAWFRVRASQPRLEGSCPAAGLAAPATVSRDARGVPWIRGGSRADVSLALGFVHAQERFFQMDLMRRQAAGELAALLGGAALEWDRQARIHRFRARAAGWLAATRPDERVLIDAYVAGVNAGLAALGSPPFEYLLLRVEPEPWRPEDTSLVLLSMFFALHDETNRIESDRAVLTDTLAPAMADFLAPPGTTWDAALQGEATPLAGLPPAAVADLRRPPPPGPRAADRTVFSELATGSNNWAVAGWRTAHGGALLAGDMHLGLGLPNIWYQAALAWPAADGGRQTIGVTLPGTPGLVAGTTTRVAWAFTNSYGDWLDWVVVEPVPGDPARYMSPDGPRPFEMVTETIAVKGSDPVRLKVVNTIWGPLMGPDPRGRPRALRWTAHDAEAVNLRLLQLEDAQDLDQLLETATACGIPPQNCVGADHAGRIGWTICGRIPRRVGFDGRTPVSWADGSRRWSGWLTPSEYPRIVDPPGGLLWTANNRVAAGGDLAKIGDSGYDLGARARQIRDGLLALTRPDEADMLKLQLDDRAVFLSRWRDQLLGVLTPAAVAANPGRAEFRRLVRVGWTGRASTDSVAYRLVRAYRLTLLDQTYDGFTGPCRSADPEFAGLGRRQWEDVLWRLVTERPMHLLDRRYPDWPAACLAAVDTVTAELTRDGRPLAAHTWGDRNTVSVRHPLSGAVPLLAEWVDMVPRPLPGDSNMPRFQSPGAGASQRLVVSPGREEHAIFHMPGGPSGHPQAPYYGAGHADWEEGRPQPLMPGAARWVLTLTPGPAHAKSN
jgi:penicillin amidase